MDPALESRMNAALREPAKAKVLEEAYREFAEQEAAVSNALPLTPMDSQDYSDLLWRFSTDKRALGLPPAVPLETTYGEWLKRYREYVKKLGKSSPKGQPGAPRKPLTDRIRHEWEKRGSPEKPSASVLDAIARAVFPTKRIEPGTEDHRRQRELTRQAIKRISKSGASAAT